MYNKIYRCISTIVIVYCKEDNRKISSIVESKYTTRDKSAENNKKINSRRNKEG